MGHTMRLPLFSKNEIVGYTLVDQEDYEKFKDIKWRERKGYATICDGKTTKSLHRLIMDTPHDMVTDHVNGDTLDNRKSNLRVCTRTQNSWNKSTEAVTGYKGVGFGGKRNPHKFRAQIYLPTGQQHLGYFDSAEDAAQSYNDAAVKYFGEFAKVNGV